MAHARRFRFGVEMMAPFDGMTWAESARHLEDLGYSTLFAPDHLHEGYGPITAMASAVMVTESLVVAPAVLAADFRHPAFLARELSSIDVLSGGRLEVGLGAGYQTMDYDKSGLPMDPPGVRVDRLIEHVAVLKGLFRPGPFSFRGQHYTITDLDSIPTPHRDGGPPIFVAGGGRRMLEFAAREADIVGVNVHLATSAARRGPTDGLAASVDERFDWIRSAAGDRFDDLEFHAWCGVARVTDDAGRVLERLRARFDGSDDDILGSPLVMVGTVDEIADRLVARRDRWGFSYFTVLQEVAENFAPVVQRLAGR
ncbi:MAG: TIGR03621 family F420-dependent LLM class oxidoreductase [Ilumatobacteraceae bacterium]